MRRKESKINSSLFVKLPIESSKRVIENEIILGRTILDVAFFDAVKDPKEEAWFNIANPDLLIISEIADVTPEQIMQAFHHNLQKFRDEISTKNEKRKRLHKK